MAGSVSWRRKAFLWIAAGCIQFVILTAVAMWFYPGGTMADPTARGYSFFTNFFSELGLTRAHSGGPNTISFILFVVALTLAGAGLVLFSVAFRPFFTHSAAAKLLSGIGSLFGIISGICFIGVAWAPADVQLGLHGQFVLWAFQAFPVAALLYAVAILLDRNYPRRYAAVFLAFGLLLVLYIMLLTRGPRFDTARAVMVQATGQKVIVYASIITILIQALGARKQLSE